MDIKNKTIVAKSLSLIDRMETKHTLNEAVNNVEQHINEATSQNRKKVDRNTIIDILNQQDSKGNGGKFASVTYVNAEQIYQTKRNWRYDDVTNALNSNLDKKEEEWYKKIKDYNSETVKGKLNIDGVIAVQRYNLHWTTQENYAKAYNDYKTKLSDLRMSYGIAINSDGMLGDNHNQRVKSDYGDANFNQTGNLSKDFNMKGSVVKSTCFVVNENGNVLSEIPYSLVKSLKALPKERKPEKEVSSVLSGEMLDAYMKAKSELDSEFSPRNLLFDKILCIAANVNGVSYYYINDAIKSEIKKKSGVYVNSQDMVKLAEEQLGESFDSIQGFEN